MRSFRKTMAFLAWLVAFVGGSTIFSPWCEINNDGLFVDIPGLHVNLGDNHYDDD